MGGNSDGAQSQPDEAVTTAIASWAVAGTSAIPDPSGDVAPLSWLKAHPAPSRGLTISGNTATVLLPIWLINNRTSFSWYAGADRPSTDYTPLDWAPNSGTAQWTAGSSSAVTDPVDSSLQPYEDVTFVRVSQSDSTHLQFEWRFRGNILTDQPDVLYYFVLNNFDWMLWLYPTPRGWEWEIIARNASFIWNSASYEDITAASVTETGGGQLQLQLTMGNAIPDMPPGSAGAPWYRWYFDRDNNTATGQQPDGDDVGVVVRYNPHISTWQGVMRRWNGTQYDDVGVIPFTRSENTIAATTSVADLGLSQTFRWATVVGPIVGPSDEEFYSRVDVAPDTGWMEMGLAPTNCARFLASLTYPDGTQVTAGQTFAKRWRLENCGTAKWVDGYQAVRISGDYGPASFTVNAEAGATVEVSASFTAPSRPGIYRATYRLQGPDGPFGDPFWVEVEVVTPSACATGIVYTDFSYPGAEFFTATKATGTATDSELTCVLEVPINRFFGGTLPGSGVRPEAIADNSGIMVRFGAQNTSGATAPVRVYVGDVEIGSKRIDASSPDRGYTVVIDRALLQDEEFIKLPDRPGFVWKDGKIIGAEAPKAKEPTIVKIVGPIGIRVTWAQIEIVGAMKPIVFVHGWTGGPGVFQNFDNWASGEDGYEDDIPHWPVNAMDLGRGVLTNEETIRQVNLYVDYARAAFGVDRVNLVGHSRGGVIVRLAFDESGFVQKAAGVITISSPHHGTVWPKIVALFWTNCRSGDEQFRSNCGQRASELLPDWMLQHINYKGCREEAYGSGRARRYRLINCQKKFGLEEQAAKQITFAALDGFQGDIGADEATFPWRNSCDRHPEPDGSVLDRPQYWYVLLGHLQTNSDPAVYSDMLQILRAGIHGGRSAAETTYSCPASPAGPAELDAAPPAQQSAAPGFQVVQEHASALAAGASEVVATRLVGDEDARVTLFASAPISLTLRAPDGAVLTPTSPGSASYSQGDAGGLFSAAYELPAALAGDWQIRAENRGTAGVSYGLLVETLSRVRLEAATDHLAVSVGEPVVLYAFLLDGDSPIALGTTMTATVEATGAQYPMHDDGQGGDTTAGDGEFTVRLDGLTEARSQALRVIAAWPDGRREQVVGLAVQADLAQVTAVGGEVAGSPDGLGRWESLVFPVTVTAQASGTLALAGKLHTMDGALVAETRQTVEVITGTQTIALSFAGAQIHDAGQAGIWQLGELELEGTLGSSLTYNQSALTRQTTQAYDWREFSGSAVQLAVGPTGTFTVGHDGQAPTLTFSATMSVDFPGEYAWKGNLYTLDGTLVASSSATTQTVSTSAPIQIAFALPDWSSTGQRPPYVLRDVEAWRTDGSSRHFFGGNQLARWGDALYLPFVRR
ncbi:MAG: alpha/beta fold hydrolase [Oscillochloris sp.]|nr:alpha/beta fold hydrolase [Oscillochloris sp.]